MDFGRKVEDKFNEARPRVEQEVRRVVTYLNDKVVPDVRQGSSRALRVAATQLSKLAEHLENGSNRAGGRD